MAGFFGGNSANSSSTPPKYTGMQLQTSSQSMPIPIVWGANRITVNLIDYFGFYSQPASKGKGFLSKGNNLDYYANIILALCEGSTTKTNNSIGTAWQGQSEINFADSGYGLYPGDESQGENPWATAVAAGHDLGYAYTMYIAQGNTPLGASATVPALWFEVFSSYHGIHTAPQPGSTVANTYDANFGDIIPDLLCNTRYGVNLPKALLVGAEDLTTYHLAQGIFVSPILREQEQVTSILSRWATIGDFWIFYTGTAVKIVPLGDAPITNNGVTYSPNLNPIYALGPDDFVVADKNSNKSSPPVKVTRKDPADGYNVVQLDCTIRGMQYNTVPYIWQDQASIDQVGIQAPNIISCTEICNVPTAQVVLPLVAQRQFNIRNTYEFKLLPNFILLEPGDLVTLTEPSVGLSSVPVRIREVSEDDKNNLSFVAEEFPGNVGTVQLTETEPWAGASPYNQLVLPPSVNPPAFVQPDLSLTQGTSELWIALSGGANWGGCGVFLSFDGVNYSQIGEADTASLQGTLTAALPEVTGLDTTSTLAIDLTESLGVIPTTATQADAQAYRTLCLVDSELLAYGNVSPTGEYTSDLTYLERGLYGTTPSAHAAGAPFSAITPTVVFSVDIPESYFNSTVYFNFPSVNPFGVQAQSLADCTEYSFSIVAPSIGAVTDVVLAAQTNPTTHAVLIQPGTANTLAGLVVTWQPSPGPNLSAYEVQFSLDGGTTWANTYTIDPVGTYEAGTQQTFTLPNPASLTLYAARVRAISSYADVASGWVQSSTLSSEAAPTTAPATPALTGHILFVPYDAGTDTPAAYGFQGQNTAPYPIDYSITEYTLSYASAAGTVTMPPVAVTPSSIESNGGVFTQTVPASSSGTPTTLADSTTFTFTLTATNEVGTSAPSAPLYLTTSTGTATTYP